MLWTVCAVKYYISPNVLRVLVVTLMVHWLYCNYLDGSLIYEKIVLPQRELDRIKRRPDDSPSDGNSYLHFT